MISVNRKIAVFYWLIVLSNGRMINTLYSKTNELELVADGYNENSFRSVTRNAIRNPRLSEADWSWYNVREPSGAGTYSFGYDNAPDSEGNEHYRTEKRFGNGTVIGEYGHTDYQNNRIVIVTYVADSRGYRASTQIVSMKDLL